MITTTDRRPTAQERADAQAAAQYAAAHARPAPCLIKDCPVCQGTAPPPPCWGCIDGGACLCESEKNADGK